MNILQGSGWFPALEFRSSATSVAMYSLASEYPDKSMGEIIPFPDANPTSLYRPIHPVWGLGSLERREVHQREQK